MHFSCLCRKKLRKCISKAFKCIQFVGSLSIRREEKIRYLLSEFEREREAKKERKQMKERMHF